MRTIAGFESGKTTPMKANLSALQRALEDAGVVFTERGVELREEAPPAPKPKADWRKVGRFLKPKDQAPPSEE